jgi:hypothetical protein
MKFKYVQDSNVKFELFINFSFIILTIYTKTKYFSLPNNLNKVKEYSIIYLYVMSLINISTEIISPPKKISTEIILFLMLIKCSGWQVGDVFNYSYNVWNYMYDDSKGNGSCVSLISEFTFWCNMKSGPASACSLIKPTKMTFWTFDKQC